MADRKQGEAARHFRHGITSIRTPGVGRHDVATAAACGLVLVRERKDAEQLLLAGRLLQRALLFATTKSLAVQPLNQLLERADREATAEVGSTFGVGMEELTPAGWEMVTAFRISHSTGTPGISPRRAVSDVVRA